MNLIPSSANDFIREIQTALGNPVDLRIESLSGGKLTVVYLSSIVNATHLQDNILGPVRTLKTSNSWDLILSVIKEREPVRRDNPGDAILDLISGRVLIHRSGDTSAFSFNTLNEAKRQPSDPRIERTARGSRISLVETYEDNISMIRSLLKDPSLRVDGFKLGTRTQTKVAVMYLAEVADRGLVEEVRRRLSRIKIDGILNAGYLEQLISDNRWSIFPLVQLTERPDKIVAGLLEGRVAVFAEGGNQCFIVPTTVNDLYQSPEDYYWGFWFGSFLRFIRILGNNIAVALPGLYIALLGVNTELLPVDFIFTVSGGRIGVAFPLVIELLLMEITVEIFREASLRLQQSVSQTLGVTAGIVLGIAAVGAGLVSNATLVVVIVTAIASYSGPDYGIGLSWRILRYIMILAATLWGLVGITIFGIIILAHAAKQNSFGVSYLAPWTPIRGIELLDTVIRRPLWMPKRPSTFHPADKVRYKDQGGSEAIHGKQEDE